MGISAMKFPRFFIFLIFIVVNNSVVAELLDQVQDQDFDGLATHIDNCPNQANRFQADFDNDGIGDACDEDSLTNKQIALIYEGIPLKPIGIQASMADGLGSCKTNNPIIQNISVPKLTEFDQYTINSIKLGFTATHEFRGDLRVTIESPQGTRIKVIDDDGGGEYTAFDIYLDESQPATQIIHNEISDNAALPFYDRSVAPFQPLSGFNGESPFGVWKIEICDAFDIEDDGEFIGATLIFREGVNTDSDSEYNVSDCAKLDPNRWQMKSVYLDEDEDGYGVGKAIEKCIGSKPPKKYSTTNDDNCPLIPNSDQHDENNDGKGDVCDAVKYQVVKRSEIAKPILQKLYGEQYKPSIASGKKFIDVKVNDFAADWIEDLASQKHGFREECARNRYCPNQIITKNQLVSILFKIKTSTNSAIKKENSIEEIKNQFYSALCGLDQHCPNEAVAFSVFENILNKVFPAN